MIHLAEVVIEIVSAIALAVFFVGTTLRGWD